MPKPPQRPSPQDLEARQVDRLLSQLHSRGGGVAQASAPRPRAQRVVRTSGPLAQSSAGVWGRVAAGVALAGAMTQWPYAHGCGWGLAGYLGTFAVVFVVGAWSAHAAWRARMGLAHLVALAVVCVSVAFAAGEVMPRMGYPPVEITWACPRPA